MHQQYALMTMTGDYKYYDLTRHIYNSLTAIYAALYRTTTPLTFDWRKDEIADLLGHDPTLIRMFSDIKTEMFWFRKLNSICRLNLSDFKQMQKRIRYSLRTSYSRHLWLKTRTNSWRSTKRWPSGRGYSEAYINLDIIQSTGV